MNFFRILHEKLHFNLEEKFSNINLFPNENILSQIILLSKTLQSLQRVASDIS